MINTKKINIIKKPILLLSIGFLVFTQQLAFSKSKIKELTSNKNSKSSKAQSIPLFSSSERKKHGVGIGVGQTVLNGDFSHTGDDKITVDLLYTYRASHSFDFFTDLHFSEHKIKQKRTNLTGLALGIKAKIYQIDAFSPFIIGGLGFYKPIVKREINGVITESISKITFGYHIGAGAELKLNQRIAVGVLGHFHNPFDVQQEDQENDVEGSYFKLLITGLYYF